MLFVNLCFNAGYSEGLWHQAAASLSAGVSVAAGPFDLLKHVEIMEEPWSKGAMMM